MIVGHGSESNLCFCDGSRVVARATNFGAKLAELADPTFIGRASNTLTVTFSTTPCKSLVKFGPV